MLPLGRTGGGVRTDPLERDLVGEIRVFAKAMDVQLVEMGQRRAKGSGSTIGLPDLAVNCAGKTVWVETKRAKGGVLSLGQEAFIARAAEMGVHVYVVDDVETFVAIVNSMRRAARRVEAAR